jgi:tetratricopeptide (TPR) repeat protein
MLQSLTQLAIKIDRATDHSDVDGLRRAIEECADALKTANDNQRVPIHYFQANAHQELYRIYCQDQDYKWQWEQEDAISGILALRRAISEPAFHQENSVRRCQIRTNLANALSQIGRPVEALEQWTTVLEEDSRFAMARGNRAGGLEYYARSLYDPGHKKILIAEAHAGYLSAVAPGALWDSGFRADVAEQYKKSAAALRQVVNIDKINAKFDPNKSSLGDTPEEQKYRRWALDHCLFLNPLNDAGAWPIAAHDVFHLPSHTYAIDEEPRFVQFYDLLKSEFIGARTLYFEALTSEGTSFPDKGVLHFDSFDGVRYGTRSEKLKASYRIAYSLFDKIAVFINDYFRLGRNIREISFRNIFYEQSPRGAPRTLTTVFSGHKNWPLRGLFSLSKDIFDQEFKETATPDGQMLDDIRNALEHRFLSLHEHLTEGKNSGAHFKVTVAAFEEKTLRILKLARAALIYLSLAVRREESLRSERSFDDPDKLIATVKGIPLKSE